MGAADDLTRNRRFLEQFLAAAAQHDAEVAAPMTRAVIDADTASGDLRAGLITLTERSHQTAVTIDRMTGTLALLQRGVTELLVAQSAITSTDNQTDRRLERQDGDIKELRAAISTVQKWRNRATGATAALTLCASAIGGVLTFAAEHLHLGK